jgi:hypothetical protein
MALGGLNDPLFGGTNADIFFNLSSPRYAASPFNHPDSVVGIDSVVLQLAYAGAYGDTSQAARVSVEVSEISKDNGFLDTILYRFDHPGFSTNGVLGNTSFTSPQFRDSLTLIRRGDTARVANVLRIRLNNSLGLRLSRFDTLPNGAYRNDSLFRANFRGLALKTTAVTGHGMLAYFNLMDARTEMRVYFRTQRNGAVDTASAAFQHVTYSQANSIERTPGGEYLANLDAPSPDKLFIQSSPAGSYASIFVPGLTNFPNKVIHRAELIAVREPSLLENIFTRPNRLFLDHRGTGDTAYLFDLDTPPTSDNSFDLSAFGGALRPDNSYRFNITRYIQGIVTRNNRNDTMRLYAPMRTILFGQSFRQYVQVPVLSVIGNGRVVLAGANHPNPASRLRLRIVYSNI